MAVELVDSWLENVTNAQRQSNCRNMYVSLYVRNTVDNNSSHQQQKYINRVVSRPKRNKNRNKKKEREKQNEKSVRDQLPSMVNANCEINKMSGI